MAFVSLYYYTVQKQLEDCKIIWDKIRILADKKANNQISLNEIVEFQNLWQEFNRNMNELNDTLHTNDFSIN